MRDVIINLFGEYTPVMTDIFNEAGEYVGQSVASGMAGVDWTYILGVLGFFIVLYSAFRLLGVFFK